jgi:hypothetical protein
MLDGLLLPSRQSVQSSVRQFDDITRQLAKSSTDPTSVDEETHPSWRRVSLRTVLEISAVLEERIVQTKWW